MTHDVRYSPDYTKNAVFTDEPCDVCGRTPALEGTYFDGDYEALCMDCLRSDRATVDIPEYLERRLMESVNRAHPEWSGERVQEHVRTSVHELERTPPVPWIQNNYWVVCHGDFAKYVGEWDQDTLASHAPDGDGKGFLNSILDPFPRPDIGDLDALWDLIAIKWAAIYVFECFLCGRLIALAQTY